MKWGLTSGSALTALVLTSLAAPSAWAQDTENAAPIQIELRSGLSSKTEEPSTFLNQRMPGDLASILPPVPVIRPGSRKAKSAETSEILNPPIPVPLAQGDVASEPEPMPKAEPQGEIEGPQIEGLDTMIVNLPEQAPAPAPAALDAFDDIVDVEPVSTPEPEPQAYASLPPDFADMSKPAPVLDGTVMPDVEPVIEVAPTPQPIAAETPPVDGPASPALRKILARGTLRVGTVLRAPYAMRAPSGQLVGHDVEISEGLARSLGVSAQIVPLPADDLVEAVRSGDVDVVIGGLAIAPETALKVNFTTPYGSAGIHLIANKSAVEGKALKPKRLAAPGTRIGVVADSVAERAARSAYPLADIVRLPSEHAAKEAFLRGEVGLLVSPSPFPEVLTTQLPDRFEMPVKEALAKTAQGIAIAQGDPEFLAFLNAWVVARTMDNRLGEIHAYWLEGTSWVKELASAQAR